MDYFHEGKGGRTNPLRDLSQSLYGQESRGFQNEYENRASSHRQVQQESELEREFYAQAEGSKSAHMSHKKGASILTTPSQADVGIMERMAFENAWRQTKNLLIKRNGNSGKSLLQTKINPRMNPARLEEIYQRTLFNIDSRNYIEEQIEVLLLYNPYDEDDNYLDVNLVINKFPEHKRDYIYNWVLRMEDPNLLILPEKQRKIKARELISKGRLERTALIPEIHHIVEGIIRDLENGKDLNIDVHEKGYYNIIRDIVNGVEIRNINDLSYTELIVAFYAHKMTRRDFINPFSPMLARREGELAEKYNEIYGLNLKDFSHEPIIYHSSYKGNPWIDYIRPKDKYYNIAEMRRYLDEGGVNEPLNIRRWIAEIYYANMRNYTNPLMDIGDNAILEMIKTTPDIRQLALDLIDNFDLYISLKFQDVEDRSKLFIENYRDYLRYPSRFSIAILQNILDEGKSLILPKSFDIKKLSSDIKHKKPNQWLRDNKTEASILMPVILMLEKAENKGLISYRDDTKSKL